ncbi:MAG: hypothetical protein NWE89_01895 [Candidatus Bathyarchaeota archaeon]|nr:hypothetical protein [Candidatus Bathyarchaeota archaeon]
MNKTGRDWGQIKNWTLRVILVFLIFAVTKLLWESPFYPDPYDKLLNVLKGWGIAILVFGGPLILYRLYGDKISWLEGRGPDPGRRYKSRDALMKGLDEDAPQPDLYGMNLDLYSEEGWMHPDARNLLTKMRKKQEKAAKKDT